MAVSQQKPATNGGSTGKPSNSSRTTMADELNFTSKRQRRPSVRLVEIGDQPAAAVSKQWKSVNRGSKTKPLTNLGDFDESKEGKFEKGGVNCENLAIGDWKIKPKKDLKRPRTNWVSKKIDDGGEFDGGSENDDNVDEEGENGFSRDFGTEGFEGQLNEENPVCDDDDDDERKLQFRAKIGDDLDDNGEQNSARRLGGKFDGVRVWLEGLGLGRYRPVFEFHEVDEEVLPLLTLEDLKDMGINAVGSRRKMFCAIQKLNEGFS